MSEDNVTDVVIDVSNPKTVIDAANDLLDDGEYNDALELAERALERFEDVEGVILGQLLTVAANAHQCAGDAQGAGALATRAVAAFEQASGEHPAELGIALHTQAMGLLHAGDIDGAAPLLDRAAACLESAGVSSRMDFCAVLLTMAELVTASGAAAEAVPLFQRVIDEIAHLPPSSDEHAAGLNRVMGRAFLGLGSAHGQQGNVDEAKDYIARAVEFFDAGYGHGHPEMTAALAEVAAIYRALDDEDAALAVEEELFKEPDAPPPSGD